MNINCFQYEDLKKCKKFEIVGHSIIGFEKGCIADVVVISEQQFKQDHNKLVYGKKWKVYCNEN